MNHWIEMDEEVKAEILAKAVSYGWLRKEFVDWILEEEKGVNDDVARDH